MDNLEFNDRDLIYEAEKAMQRAYAPYSGFKVGAALLCGDGTVFTGCNIENSSYGLTNCAERTALFTAVSYGYDDFIKMAIVGGQDGKISAECFPCGACRQVMTEFCNWNFEIILWDGKTLGALKHYTLAELMPKVFSLK